MGYAGGSTPYPTYRSIGDHAETVQIDYDPGQITYEKLLDAFWRSHDPNTGFGQYRSVIFYHNEAQRTAAVESMARAMARLGQEIRTALIPYAKFYLAEEYHQKYYLQSNAVLFNEISLIYPDFNDLVDSTSAARLNGFIAGFGDEVTVQAQLDQFGLFANGREELRRIIERGLEKVCPEP